MKKQIKKIKKEKLTIDSDSKAAEVTVALETMISTEGWRIMKQIFDVNIENLETQIIEKKDSEGKLLTELETDRLRDKLGYLKEVIKTPENYIARLERQDTPKEDFDPYYSSIIELRKAQQK